MKKVLLFSGRMQSGKNQFAEYVSEICKEKGLKVVSDLFAADLKEWSKQDFKGLSDILNSLHTQFQNEIYKLISNRQSYGISSDGVMENLFKLVGKLNISDENWFENKTDITRALLQIYGTQIFRNRVDNDFWIKRTKERIINNDADIVIITDVRFPNEVDFMSSDKYDTYTVRINRPIDRTGQQHEHISETALDDYTDWDYIIDNDKELYDLKECACGLVDDIVKEELCQVV